MNFEHFWIRVFTWKIVYGRRILHWYLSLTWYLHYLCGRWCDILFKFSSFFSFVHFVYADGRSSRFKAFLLRVRSDLNLMVVGFVCLVNYCLLELFFFIKSTNFVHFRIFLKFLLCTYLPLPLSAENSKCAHTESENPNEQILFFADALLVIVSCVNQNRFFRIVSVRVTRTEQIDSRAGSWMQDRFLNINLLNVHF